ncbi:MAG: hypothetical protein BGO87_04585 [Flavobacteriia bacterium 40-80]|nr:MAG: hypothetical protein BGO87_04585 [Flavobacteriia bacterium 40-80]
MNKKNILVISSLIMYCFLFYKQTIGINILLFNLLLIISLLAADLSLLKNKKWLIVACCSVITATGSLLYGSFLSAFTNVISLLLLANLSLEKEASLFFSLIQSIASYIVTPVLRLFKSTEVFDRKTEEESNKKESIFSLGNILKITIPAIVLLFFFQIYKNSNPVFHAFIDRLHLDISWDFIQFSIFGLFLMYGFFKQSKINGLAQADQSFSNNIKGFSPSETSVFTSGKKEYDAAQITFISLNLLLLVVNFLDIQFLFNSQIYSAYMYSQYVHQGINSSVFSVLIAILVTLYFFRGNINFTAGNKRIRRLAAIWIILNIALLFFCFEKNTAYIRECGLTHKRIGVYFYIFITFIGLLTTLFKIYKTKSNMYLVRINTWFLFLTLTVSCLFNWNRIILEYNVRNKPEISHYYYLYNLPETSLPFLLKNQYLLFDSASQTHYEKLLKRKEKKFMKRFHAKQWQSWNFEEERIFRELKKIPKQ